MIDSILRVICDLGWVFYLALGLFELCAAFTTAKQGHIGATIFLTALAIYFTSYAYREFNERERF